MAVNPSMRRALLPALMLTLPPLLLLLTLRLIDPSLLTPSWPWLLVFVYVAAGISLFGRYLYRRAVLVGDQLLAASRGEVGVAPFDDDPRGPVQQALTVILDQHRRSQQALRASEQRFQLALEASDAHLWEHCLQSGKLTFDASIGRMFLKEGEPLGETDMPLQRFIDIIHPDDRPRLQRAAAEFYRSGEFNCEYRCRRLEHGYVWMRCRGRVMERAEDGTPLRALGTMTDISDLKQIEEQLQAALITAQDANHARAQFFAGISHELRTPLNGVLGYTQLLLRDAEVVGEPRRHIEAVERCGQHLLDLINDIIELARVDSEHIELQEVECDLHALLDNIALLVHRQAEEKQLRFALELDPQLPSLLLLDELKLRQVLINLLNNAVRFTERGSVTLRVRVDASSSTLHFEVQDTGIGIEATKLTGLLERLRPSGDDGSGGLGLAVSQRLCRLMGGRIAAESRVGSGSCFRFSLPCRPLGQPLAPVQRVTVTAAPAPASEPLQQLPATALVPLHAALALGDPEGLRQALATLGQQVPAAQALIDRCHVLLEGFELERIRELLEDPSGNV